MNTKRRRPRVRMRIKEFYELLNRLNVSQNRLAQLAGLSPSHLSQVLSGKRHPGTRTRRRIQEALDVEFDELFEMEGDDDA